MTDTFSSIPIEEYRELLAPKPTRPRKAKAMQPETIDPIDSTSPKTDTANIVSKIGWSPDDIQVVSGTLALLIIELTKAISQWATETDQYGMDDLESQVVSKAGTRILLRHIKIKGAKKGDVSDGLLIGLTLAAYGVRVNNARTQFKREKKEREKDNGSSVKRT